MRKLRNIVLKQWIKFVSREEREKEAKQGKPGAPLSLFLHWLCLTGRRGGNVKINVDGIGAKSGQNGGNFGATQSSSFVAGSCCNLATAPLFFALHTCSVIGLSQFISLTLPDCQCNMSGKQQVIVGKKKLDQIFLFHQRNASMNSTEMSCSWLCILFEAYQIMILLQSLESCVDLDLYH